MRRCFHGILVAAVALASVALAPLSAQGREPTARWASPLAGQPAWKAWWELERVRIESTPIRLVDYQFQTTEMVDLSQVRFLDPTVRFTPGLKAIDAARKALIEQLAHETNGAVLAGTLIALGKMGAAPDGSSSLVDALVPFLRRPEARTREAAWIALAALCEPSSSAVARDVLADSARGRELAAATTVDERTRTFAAYALARVTRRYDDVEVARTSEKALRSVLAEPHTSMLEAACVHALGLVIDEHGDVDALEFLVEFGADGARSPYARGQAALALVRGVEPLDGEAAETWRARAADALRAWIGNEKSPAPLRRQTALALGRLGALETRPELHEAIAGALRQVVEHESDDALAGEALLALAQASAGIQPATSERKEELARFLIARLDAQPTLRPWVALACGRMAWMLRNPADDLPSDPATLAALRSVIRTKLRDAGAEAEPFVIAAHMAGDAEAHDWAIERAQASEANALARELAAFLGSVPRYYAEPQTWNLAGAGTALRALAARASNDAAVFYTACRSRVRLVDDNALTDELLGELGRVIEPTRRAILLDALGASSDRRAVKPLLGIAVDADAAPDLRAHALAALGELLDKEPRPWNSCFAEDLDPLDAPPTLLAADGTGLLDYR